MLVFQGLADPIFSATDIARWTEQTQRDTGADVVRLFMVPGMTHCGGGPAFEDFDPLTAMESWLATGVAPTSMPAQGRSFPGRSMPLCAHPAHAQYIAGDVAQASSFRCVSP